ncbi:hypothetical protein [Streptomyces rubiginosohelvolus]
MPLVAVSAHSPDVENRAAAPSQKQKQKQKQKQERKPQQRTDCTTQKESP